MKIKFREVKLSAANRERLKMINNIIAEYQRQGYVLTLRQLYYQLVSRDVIPNKQTEYSKLSNLLKEGRMAGIVDWDAIEDRLRQPDKPAEFDSPRDILDAAINQYRKARQQGQPYHIEVWVEKDALSGVLKRVTRVYGVPIMINRGYSSASAMFDSYQRFLEAFENNQKVVVLYLGDFDPSGVDMIRDIKTRIDEFIVGSDAVREMFNDIDIDEDDFWRDKYGEYYYGQGLSHNDVMLMLENEFSELKARDFEIKPIALTLEQIREFNPPPNPAKITDPRAKDFIARYGGTSWEVDALKPEVLNNLLEKNIKALLDIDKYEAILTQEKKDKARLIKFKDTL